MTDSSRVKIIFTSIGGEEYIFNGTLPLIITKYSLSIMLRENRKKLESYIFMQKSNIIHKYFSREITEKCTIKISFVVVPEFDNITRSDFRYFSRQVFYEINFPYSGNYYVVEPNIFRDTFIRKRLIAIDVLFPCGKTICILVRSYRWSFAIDDIITTIKEYTGITGTIKFGEKELTGMQKYTDYPKDDYGVITLLLNV